MLNATRRHSKLTFSFASRDWSFIMNERNTRLISRICTQIGEMNASKDNKYPK